MSPRVIQLSVGLVGFFFFLGGVWETLVRGMESLTNHWRNLSLIDREGGKLSVKRNRANQEYTIAAKFLMTRVLNTEVIVRTFSPLWQARNGFKVREAKDHIRHFVFDNVEEVDKIMASEPWSFDRHLVILHKLANVVPV